jgi:hypothetical protein
LWAFGIFCGYSVCLVPVLVCGTKKNLATLALKPFFSYVKLDDFKDVLSSFKVKSAVLCFTALDKEWMESTFFRKILAEKKNQALKSGLHTYCL